MTLDQFGGVATQIARLERGVSDGGALATPLDHREQQIGVGIALGSVKHVVNPLH